LLTALDQLRRYGVDPLLTGISLRTPHDVPRLPSGWVPVEEEVEEGVDQ
jgi:hypothetical protein